MSGIKLGYAVGTAEVVYITPSHMIVTGLTNKSGKTTTIESVSRRHKGKVLIFRTKHGEKTFLEGRQILPYFEDKTDWRYIQSLIEAITRQKMSRIEQSKIIQLCKKAGTNSLLGFKEKVDEKMAELDKKSKTSSYDYSMLTNIQAYLEEVVPILKEITFASSLTLENGINICDLEQYDEHPEVQAIIIGSMLKKVRYTQTDTIVVLPESWKFIPQKTGSPCKAVITEFVRQGATDRNFLWFDAQELASIDKGPLKQVSEAILGYQSEPNEVKHTLAHVPLPDSSKDKPVESDIQTLKKGEFIYCTREKTVRVYVQPFWISDELAINVALGKITVDDLPPAPTQKIDSISTIKHTVKTSTERRMDATNTSESNMISPNFELGKLCSITDTHQKKLDKLEEITTDHGRMLATLANKSVTTTGIDLESLKRQIIQDVMKNIPSNGTTVLQVSPLEKLNDIFLEEAKQKIISDVNSLEGIDKKILKYLEAKQIPASINEIVTKGLFLKMGGGTADRTKKSLTKMMTLNLVVMDGKAYSTSIKTQIKSLVGNFNADETQLELLYNHIINELLQ